MAFLDLESLLAPLGDDAPCGPNLEHDAAWLALEQAAAGKAEQQFGDTVIEAQGPDWRVVWDRALDLAARTRDLRVAVWLVRAGTRLHGLPGTAEGLALLHGLLDRFWPGVWPLLDASENDDPIERVNALMPLAHPAAGLADVRSAGLDGARSRVTVRQVELALLKADARANETVPLEAEISQTLLAHERQARAQGQPGVTVALQQAMAALKAVESTMDGHVGADANVDLTPLRQVFFKVGKAVDQVLAALGDAAAAAPPAGGAAADAAAAAPAPVVSVPGQIASRADALAAIDRICGWYEAQEPGHPAPLLLRRAQRLMSMSFLDIVRDMAPDALGQVRGIAGITEE